MSKEKEAMLGFRCSHQTKTLVQKRADLKGLTVSDYLRLNIHLFMGSSELEISTQTRIQSNNTSPKQ